MHLQTFTLASQFELRADVKKDVDPAKVEAAIADEWTKFLKDGPTDDELARAKTGIQAGFLRGLEKVGGFGGKAVVLAESQVYLGDPAARPPRPGRVPPSRSTNSRLARFRQRVTSRARRPTPTRTAADESIRREVQ